MCFNAPKPYIVFVFVPLCQRVYVTVVLISGDLSAILWPTIQSTLAITWPVIWNEYEKCCAHDAGFERANVSMGQSR